MPISYEQDDRRRLLTITLTDPFRFDDLLDQVDRQWAGAACGPTPSSMTAGALRDVKDIEVLLNETQVQAWAPPATQGAVDGVEAGMLERSHCG